MINEVRLLTGNDGVSHNGIFRGKNLGTINNLNEYIAFRTAHGIDDNSYKDLFLGDYFKINDGTFNTEWIVAHFDYYYAVGNGAQPTYLGTGTKGVVLIPKTTIFSNGISMNATNTTEGGYKATLTHTTHCPAVGAAMQTVFGAYLKSIICNISNRMDPNVPSNGNPGAYGSATGWEWVSTLCICPTEVQIFGSQIWSSGPYDTGEGCEKFAIFNFINHIRFARFGFWLRSIVSNETFAFCAGNGFPVNGRASDMNYLRPIIYIN